MTAPQRHVTSDEYLAFEREAEGRHEYYDGQIYAMSGVTRSHDRIVRNVYRELETQFRAGPCEYFTNDLRVKASPSGLYTYPDASALCAHPEFEDPSYPDVLLNPSVLIEVLSDSTELYDRGRKFAHYRQIASLHEYVIVAQSRVYAERFTRAEPEWVRAEYDGPDAVLELMSVGTRIRVGDLYERVEFPRHPPGPRRVREPESGEVYAAAEALP